MNNHMSSYHENAIIVHLATELLWLVLLLSARSRGGFNGRVGD